MWIVSLRPCGGREKGQKKLLGFLEEGEETGLGKGKEGKKEGESKIEVTCKKQTLRT